MFARLGLPFLQLPKKKKEEQWQVHCLGVILNALVKLPPLTEANEFCFFI
jgi:hypothetical protein